MGLPPRRFSYRYSFRCCALRQSTLAAVARIYGSDFPFTLPRGLAERAV
jgi:hypothetical protein